MASNDNYDPQRDKELHDDAKAAGGTAGAALGCLGISLLPWSLVFVVIAIAIIIWLFKSHYTG